jgi:hypothetical protein
MIASFLNPLLAQAELPELPSGISDPVPAQPGAIEVILSLAFVLFLLVAMWRVFAKAGKPGWAILVPIYNSIVMLQIAGRPWWWLFLFLLPLVNLVIAIIVMIDFAKSFGKGVGFGLGLTFLGFIFFPILAFSGARYQGPSHAAA